MLKPKIALIDSDLASRALYITSFREKYEVFEFSSTDPYLDFLEKEKVNPFNVLIINIDSKGNKSAIDSLKFCYQNNLKCAFIAISKIFKKNEILELHNLGAEKIYNLPIKIDLLNSELQNIFYKQHIENLNKETEIICLKLAQHTDFFINILNEFVPNHELNKLYTEQFPNEGIHLDFKFEIQSLEEHFYTNTKMRDILLKQSNINHSENLLS